MGNYNFIRYCNTNISSDVNNKLLEGGFTLRGSDIKGKKINLVMNVFTVQKHVLKKIKNFLDFEIY